MNKDNYCVIMAGGIGARFWPMSRTDHPKQFIDILGTGKTLITQTFERLLKICPKENIYIVTNENYKELVKHQIVDISEDQIICEPSRRNTAPCIAYACYKLLKINPNANIVVAPSDHVIINDENFTEIILSGLNATKNNDWLVTLGINPTRPDTGYGYIQFNEENIYPDDQRMKKVKTFTEKPNLETALTFVQSGDFLWNAGIFIWSLNTIIRAFEKYLPEINTIFKDVMNKYCTPQEEGFIREAYTTCKSISIDYGIMEKADNVYVMCSDFGWSDLGTWGSLYDNRQKDNHGNAIIGKNVLMYDSKNCIVNMPKDKLVVLQGLEDYIVVESDHILLICRKTDEQQIRNFVTDVKIEKGSQFV
jgi:mannose-1-phosphate guanylyltransferase